MPAYYLEIIVVVLGLVLLMVEAFVPKLPHRVLGWIAMIGLGVVFGLLFIAKGADVGEGTEVAKLWSYYTADKMALYYKGFALLATICVLALSLEYLPVLRQYLAKGTRPPSGEYLTLPIFTCAGLMWMASAIDLTSIFVALEVVTISFYVMVAFMRRNVGSLESGVKLLILGALSTGFFVYGLAWLYGLSGATGLPEISQYLANIEEGEQRAALFAFALMVVGLGFKIGVFPFHIWIPDVYQGAPTPTTSYLATASKAAGAIVLGRIAAPYLSADLLNGTVGLIFAILAGATILFGYLAAIPQTNFKRLLAYTSIASGGSIFLALACSSSESLSSTSVIAYYLASQFPALFLCFLALVIVRREFGGEEIADFNGLGKRSPFLAAMVLIGLTSLAGLPPLSGFWGKLQVLWLGIEEGRWIPVILLLIGTAAAFYFYFKVIRAMYWNTSHEEKGVSMTMFSRVLLVIFAVLTILFWLLPLASYLGSGDAAVAAAN